MKFDEKGIERLRDDLTDWLMFRLGPHRADETHVLPACFWFPHPEPPGRRGEIVHVPDGLGGTIICDTAMLARTLQRIADGDLGVNQ